MRSFASIAQRFAAPQNERGPDSNTKNATRDLERQPTPRLDWSFRDIASGHTLPGRSFSSLPRPAIQRKLVVNEPGDRYEQEADRVAEQVMRMPGPGLSPPATAGSAAVPMVQRKCSKCEEEEKLQRKCDKCEEEEKLHRKSEGGQSSPATAPPIVHDVLNSPGQPLDSATRAFFEPRFGYQFSKVRLHTDRQAQESARSVKAKAYTVGSHIVLGRGHYTEGSESGRSLLAHELSHVVQQSRGSTGASPAESAQLEASAQSAADQAIHGHSVNVSGVSTLGMARQSLFDQFSAGAYSWPLLQQALQHTRPVATILSDINSLSSTDRDQAIKDITQERTTQARKLADLFSKLRAQTNPTLKDVIRPMIPPVEDVIARADQVLDGLFATIALAETRTSLRAGTVVPTAAQKPLIESALKPDLQVTSAGVVQPFKENIPGDPKSYLDKLREETPLLIEDHHQQQVDNRGKAEHHDPTKVHALSEFERIGNASKRETDKVFGQYKTGPALKADTSAARGNIHDLFADTETRLKGMNANQKREMAKQLVSYFFQSDDEIGAINATHNADPKFTPAGAPTNDEARDQKQIVDESTATPAAVLKLNEIDRGWDASAQAGQINIQIFKQPDQTTGPLAGPNVADRDFMWDMFQTLIHEYLHTLAHPAYNVLAASFGDESNQSNTLIEGVDSLLDETVWSAVAPHVVDQALRDDVEGPAYSSLPPINVLPASRRRYASYAQAVKLVNVVGIRNLYAAYFLGDVTKIKG